MLAKHRALLLGTPPLQAALSRSRIVQVKEVQRAAAVAASHH